LHGRSTVIFDYLAHQGLATSINMPFAPLAHRADPLKSVNSLKLIMFIYISKRSSGHCPALRPATGQSCPNRQDSNWCIKLFSALCGLTIDASQAADFT
jgi:hypothetical protein